MIPFATNFYILLVQMAILGMMDGVYLCFIVPISFDVSESPKLANHAAGMDRFAMHSLFIVLIVVYFNKRVLPCSFDADNNSWTRYRRQNIRNIQNVRLCFLFRRTHLFDWSFYVNIFYLVF